MNTPIVIWFCLRNVNKYVNIVMKSRFYKRPNVERNRLLLSMFDIHGSGNCLDHVVAICEIFIDFH